MLFVILRFLFSGKPCSASRKIRDGRCLFDRTTTEMVHSLWGGSDLQNLASFYFVNDFEVSRGACRGCKHRLYTYIFFVRKEERFRLLYRSGHFLFPVNFHDQNASTTPSQINVTRFDSFMELKNG